ncbi:N-6 DNA methylase [Candidatus Roizmanbacteria bacterium]|nr:N-6 DNA methylase [Candidatus Roizmanbacteria bacterium]
MPLIEVVTGGSKSSELTKAIEAVAVNGSAETRGAVFTRREVVEFILDLTGYTADKKLFEQRILEPSFGHGDFLLPTITRLISSWKEHSGKASRLFKDLGEAIYAVELHKDSYSKTRQAVIKSLISTGISDSNAESLAESWLHQGDFLLASIPGSFEYVVGNPPYVRQELISSTVLNRYRQLYSTLYDRADLYIPFIERSLKLLSPNGCLGYICADRWMKNRYGGPLRDMVSRDYHLDIYVDMTDTDAFHSEVSAYPAVTVIRKGTGKGTRIYHRPVIDSVILERLAKKLTISPFQDDDPEVQQIFNVANGSEPWILESSDQLDLLRRIESEFPTLTEAGCKVGIGVATGADTVFTGKMTAFDIEQDRLLPLVKTDDIRSGQIDWRGKGVINPFRKDGHLVSLEDYPKLARYLIDHKRALVKRHCAQSSPDKWYRTIDRIWPELTYTPKLLIPDIKGEAHVVFDEGNFYPHHNLYYIVSEQWDLRALQAVLLSRIAKLFVSSYSTKMRGGYLRFQAQYLRRIRLPFWDKVPKDLRKELSKAAKFFDIEACNKAAFKLYRLNQNERSALGGNGE